jgi:hypothetical protein
MALDFVTLAVNSAADGSGTTTDTVARSGQILAIGLDYAASAAAGTDVVVSCANPAGPALTIITVSDNKADGWYYPRAGAVSPANAAIAGSAVPIPFHGNLRVAVAQAGGAVALVVKATIFYEDGR